ncbi:MAG: hypothetical protein M1483_03570 [Actinobacteria bacterium]|nr:hypothetical protein [Actinomycetota bacterium]MCL6104702.1 hypothetical protein [Actinomycetota bacterium]
MKEFLAENPHVHIHSSWLNRVELNRVELFFSIIERILFLVEEFAFTEELVDPIPPGHIIQIASSHLSRATTVVIHHSLERYDYRALRVAQFTIALHAGRELGGLSRNI